MRAPVAAAAAILTSLVAAGSVARAQSDEPQPPGGGPMKIDVNAREEAPPPPPTVDGSPQRVSERKPIGQYQLGARFRGIFVPHSFFAPFLAHDTGTSMESWSTGLELIYRRQGYDVVTSLDFSWLDVHNGNYLGSGHPPDLDTHYLEFKNLSFLSADVSIIGYHKFTHWLELRYGGGLGIGWVPGDVYLANNSNALCTAANAKDTKACYPVSPTQGPIKPGDPGYEDKLNKTNNGTKDTAQDPHWHASEDKPPVMGVVNILLGVRFYPARHVAVTVEGGFRNAMFVGAGLHYLF
jgi:hypothetical protein